MEFKGLSSGHFLMGTNDGHGFQEDYEGPQTSVNVEQFQIATTTVTNEEFSKFIDATGYLTTAEQYGTSFVFYLLMDESIRDKFDHVAGAPWWLVVPNANWKHPYGQESTNKKSKNHPVVHVSLRDALAYCKWTHTSLPSEAEWEYAARGGVQTEYPWGTSLTENNKFHANTWQGNFPNENSLEDGYLGTAPVKSYEPHNGLYQMIGNIWEWCRNPR